jgi:Raf kinase inhibitor-like YbhB/YbcL family protein
VTAAGAAPPLPSPAVRVVALVIAGSCAASLAACDTGDGREFSRPPTSDQNQSVLTSAPDTTPTIPPTSTFELSTVAGPSTAAPIAGEAELTLQLPWADEGVIDVAYTCEGFGVTPDVIWSAVPPETVELGLAFIDLDAQGFVHWVVTGIPAGATSIIGGALPPGAVAHRNDFGDAAYGGPCPPEGEHQYLLTLYALPSPLGFFEPISGQEAINALEAGSIAQVSAAGRFAPGGIATDA